MVKWRAISRLEANLELDEVKQHLHIYGDNTQDDMLAGLIITSLEMITIYAGEPFISTEIEAYYPAPSGLRLELPHRTASSITQIRVYDAIGFEEIYDEDIHLFDPTGEYPAVVLEQPITSESKFTAPIVVAYRAGPQDRGPDYGAFKSAQKMIIGDLYASTVSYSVENASQNDVVLRAVSRFLAPYRKTLN